VNIFLDANILFSAAWHRGAVHALLRMLLRDRHTLIVDRVVIEEARRNLEVHRPGSINVLEALCKKLIVMDSYTRHTKEITDLALPQGDAHVVACAINAECDILMTGDKRHFGSHYRKRIHGVLVLPPADVYTRVICKP
jgi:uncharacterized protein